MKQCISCALFNPHKVIHSTGGSSTGRMRVESKTSGKQKKPPTDIHTHTHTSITDRRVGWQTTQPFPYLNHEKNHALGLQVRENDRWRLPLDPPSSCRAFRPLAPCFGSRKIFTWRGGHPCFVHGEIDYKTTRRGRVAKSAPCSVEQHGQQPLSIHSVGVNERTGECWRHMEYALLRKLKLSATSAWLPPACCPSLSYVVLSCLLSTNSKRGRSVKQSI